MNIVNAENWQQSRADVFWGEIAPAEHVIQIYEDQDVFLDTLAGFVGGGINAGDCIIVIATASHLAAVETRLKNFGISVSNLIRDSRYIPLDAHEVLAKFMINGWPDELLFMETVSKLINRANCTGRKVRAFGEMVAILWAENNSGATVNLEYLWNKFCQKQAFSLFCAYPKSGFTDDLNDSLTQICNCHSKRINGNSSSLTHILYKNTN